MRKLVLLLFFFMATTVHAQLEKGKKLAGFGVNIISNDDLYYSTLAFAIGSSEKDLGLNILPTFGYAAQRNWLIGAQAILGAERWKSSIGTPYERTDVYTDIGLAPFTRLYLDISRNGVLKFYGAAAIECVTSYSKTTYSGGAAPSTTKYSRSRALGSIGAGFAYFGKKLTVDLSMSNTALRIGFYHVWGSGKK